MMSIFFFGDTVYIFFLHDGVKKQRKHFLGGGGVGGEVGGQEEQCRQFTSNNFNAA